MRSSLTATLLFTCAAWAGAGGGWGTPPTAPTTDKPDEVTVATITRLTPPVYQANNMFFAIRDAWSRDGKRLMLYEAQVYQDPSSGKRGRGLVWGYVDELKAWRTVADYEAVAHPVYTGKISNREWPGNSTYWSPLPGEENVLYHLFRPTASVSRYNVDTKERTDVLSYDPGDGTNIAKARSFGWTSDYRFVVNFDDESGSSGGYLIDVNARQRVRYGKQPDRFSPESQTWPQRGHGHGHASPNRRLYYTQYGDRNRDLADALTGQSLAKLPALPDKRGVTHISWRASDNWFLGNDYGIYRSPTPTRPTLDPYGLWQVWTDGTAKLLLTQETAAHWQPKDKPRVVNWNAHFIATLSQDGRQAIWTSTDGKYSYADFLEAGVANWGPEGMFLADLAPVRTDVVPPAPPTGLQATPMSASKVELTWAPATDNQIVVGYRMFRDARDVGRTTATSFVDRGLRAATRYQYQVRAYDPSGNSSAPSVVAAATTRGE